MLVNEAFSVEHGGGYIMLRVSSAASSSGTFHKVG